MLGFFSSAHQATADSRSRARGTLASGVVGSEGAGASNLLILDHGIIYSATVRTRNLSGQGEKKRGLTPSQRTILAHDVEMRSVTVLIRRLRAPHLVPVRGAQVRDHDGDGVSGAGAVALAARGDGAHVRQLVALAAATAAPTPRAAEEVLRARCSEDFSSWVGLPGGHCASCGAAAGADLTVVVMSCRGVT